MRTVFLREKGERDLLDRKYQNEIVIVDSCLTMRNANLESINISYSTVILDNMKINKLCAKNSIVFLRNCQLTSVYSSNCPLDIYNCQIVGMRSIDSNVKFDKSIINEFSAVQSRFEIKGTNIRRLIPREVILSKYTPDKDKESNILVKLEDGIFTNQTNFRIPEIHCKHNLIENYIGISPKKLHVHFSPREGIIDLFHYGDSEIDLHISIDEYLIGESAIRIEGICKVNIAPWGSYRYSIICNPMIDAVFCGSWGPKRLLYREKDLSRYYTSMIIGKLEEGKLPGFEKDAYLCDKRISWLIDQFL